MTNDQLKFKVISLLLKEEDPKGIADQLDAPLATVLRYKRELKVAQENDTIDKIIDIDQAMLGEVMDGIQANTPAALEGEVIESLGTLSKSKNALDVLQTDLIVSATALNLRLKSLALSAENIGELSMIADILSTLQNAFFNKNGTQVLVQNFNKEGEVAYGQFLGDKPGD